MMKTHKFARKPFYVDAVRVSEANFNDVADWCEGTVETDENGQIFVCVKVHRPLNERQTQAFIGDWVLFAGTGYKVYTPKAFDKSFEKVKTLTKAQADAAGIKVPHEPRRPKVGAVGQALISAQKKAPVPAPPKVAAGGGAGNGSVLGGTGVAGGGSSTSMAQESDLGANSVQAVADKMPAFNMARVEEAIADSELTEEQKAANAQALIDEVLTEA